MALPKLDVPIYETKLLSNGKTIKFRPFLVKEQKLFLMATQSEDVKDVVDVIKQVLKNCILTEKIDIDELPTFDLEHVFLQLRAKSVGEVVNLQYNCNNVVKTKDDDDVVCDGVVKFKIDLTKLDIIKDEKHSNTIQFTENLGIVMKYPNFKLFNNFENNEAKDELDLIINSVDYIFDKDNMYYAKDTSHEEMVEFFENMQQEDFEKVLEFFQTMPKISKGLHFKCPKCNYEEDIIVEGIQNFFG